MKFKPLLISLALGLALLWLPGVWLAPAAARPVAATRYVDDAGSDATDCSQSTSPCQTIQYAVDRADAGDEIRVAAGDYGDTVVRPATAGYDGPPVITQVVYISETLTIRGGYSADDWNTSDPVNNPTTLDAEGGKRVVFAGGNVTVTLENLRITNGDASGLGGGSWGGEDAGGGVYVVTATAILNHCEIVSNTAQAGGGLFLDGSAATLDGNTIISNSATCNAGGSYGDGGGLFLSHSPATLNGNRIASNRAEFSGSGLFVGFGSDAALVNNVVADNQIAGPFSFGCGLYVSGSSPRLLHSTIARNTGGTGAGVCVASDPSPSTVAMTNTILVSHTVGIDVQAGNTVTLEATLWGSGAWANGVDTLGAGTILTGAVNVWGNPDFADDYYIGDNSAALNAGVAAGVTTDIDGQTRDSQPDIGADEGFSCTALNSVDIAGPTTGALGSSHTFVAAIAPPTATLPVTYTWQATGQSDVVTTAHELSHNVSFAWSAGVTGTKTITVTAANCGSIVSQTHTITLELAKLYLPLVARNWPLMTWHTECVDCPPIIDSITQGSIALDSAGNPHVAYGGVKLYHAWRDETGWQVEVADPSFQVGAWAAIALDGDDYPHISYYDSDAGDLKYAHWDGSDWISETVDIYGGWDSYIAIDSNDLPHIAYRDALGFSGTALKYAHWNGSTWQIDTIKDLASAISSRNTTLALDGDNQPHISYSISDSGDPDYLYHAYLDGGNWMTETVATAEYIGDNAITLNSAGNPRIIYYAIDGETGRLGYARWDSGQWQNDTLITSDNSIAALSLALDGSDVPHASYYLNADTSMHYAHLNGTWQFETVESGLRLEMGEKAALALDNAGQPHLLYLLDNTTLQYAHQEDAAWQTEAVAQGGDPGRYNSMVLDQEERPHIVYADKDRMQLRYAAWDGSAWQTQAVAQGDWDYAFDYAGLALDEDGHPHIAYNKDDVFWGDELHYARWDGSAWQTETLFSKDVNSASDATALVLDNAGRPHIVHGVWDGIAHTYWDGAAWKTETVDAQAESISSRLSLTIDGAGKLHLAYWDMTSEALKYAYKDGAGWHVQPVDVEGRSPWIALDSAGRPHISYCRIPGGFCEELRYARWDGAQWQISTLESGSRTGFYTSLAFDSADRPRISYYNLDEGSVKYARWDGTTWQIETVSSGSYPSLALDSAGRPHISYYTGYSLQYTWWGEAEQETR